MGWTRPRWRIQEIDGAPPVVKDVWLYAGSAIGLLALRGN